jgi:RNA polymerase-associated protein RTF1
MDVKVRSQERKKTVEGKVDKKTQAMDALKASRDAKIQRQQEKEEKIKKEQDRKRENRNRDDDDLDLKRDSDAASSVGGDKRAKKLKASDVYSDDSGSDYEDDNKKIKQEKDKSASDSDSRSSDSEDDERNKKPQYVETMDDLTRMRLSRFKLER